MLNFFSQNPLKTSGLSKSHEKQMVFSIYLIKIQGEGVRLFIFFAVSSVFLFPSSWGDFTEDEKKQAWAETGFGFETLNQKLTVETCYESEKKFSACLMAFHQLLSEDIKDESHQLRVSDLNKLEIVPFSRPDHLTLEDFLASNAKRRESFRLLFRTQLPGTEEFNDIVQQVLKFTWKIPREDQSKLAGDTYNAYLKEAFDPKTTLHPLELISPKFNKDSVEVGAFFPFHKLENGEIALAVHPFEGSPAKAAGLRDGDLILGIDGFDIRGLPFHDPQVKNEFLSRLKGPMDSQVRFRVLGFCENHEKEVEVKRGVTDKPVHHWLESKRFVNLTQQEPVMDCDEPENPSTEGSSVGQIPEDQDSAGSVKLQASYLPLKTFQFPQRNSLTDAAISVLMPYYSSVMPRYPVCAEFLLLQTIDINNPFSWGMIIDLRNNEGGNFHEVACMLNTIIQSNEIMARYLPIKNGEIINQSDESETYYFTGGGFPSANPKLPLMTYNKNIVVIVDQLSTSAAEIFAGVIQDMGRGWVIGDRTFGKGIAQESPPPIQLTSKPGDKSTPLKPLQLSMTTGVYVLGSGRSPQGAGIIPDLRFTNTGEPIENEVNYTSLLDQVFFNNIQFENSPWEQNRPEELAKLNDCINKPDRMGQTLKEKIQKDKKYSRPFVTDYLLELAKDILFCTPPRPSFIPSPYLSPLYDMKYEK